MHDENVLCETLSSEFTLAHTRTPARSQCELLFVIVNSLDAEPIFIHLAGGALPWNHSRNSFIKLRKILL